MARALYDCNKKVAWDQRVNCRQMYAYKMILNSNIAVLGPYKSFLVNTSLRGFYKRQF